MRRTLLLGAALLFAGCASLAGGPTAPNPKTPPAFGPWGIDLNAMDKTVAAGDNFFLYVNGTWLKTSVIPPDRASTGSFQDLRILSERRMKDILAEFQATDPSTLSNEERKLCDLYAAFLDTNQIESRGLEPAKKDLNYFAHLKTLHDVARAMGSIPLATTSLFDVSITVDPKNSSAYVIHLAAGGLGMPDRDYYLRDDKELAATRAAYRKYLGDMLSLAGFKNAQARAQRLFDLETKIAREHWTRADRRDADKTYNPMSFSELKALAPQFDWDANFAEAGIPTRNGADERRVVVAEKSAFAELSKIFASTSVDVWRDYLVVHYLHSFSAMLPKRFDDADFSFYGTALQGNTQQLDRPTRGVHLVDDELGEALGKLYVARYFPPDAKAKAEALVANIMKAYEADVQTLTWLSKSSREKALDKIHKFTPHVGYPDKWRDYSALAISRDDLVGDIQRGNQFEWNRELKRLDDAVDKSEWGMTPPTINAYYRRDFNAIFFPAAIMQPPFFDPNADDAVNYGSIGVVIGHEISHGFDDQGSKYTGDGRLENWWTDEDRKSFDARVTRLSDQFDTYEPLPGLHINGRSTLGENIADLAGLNIALKAYHISLAGRVAPELDGFTGDQRFFLGFAQVWRAKYRDGAMRAQILSNPHSPPEYRVIGPTRNDDAWYAAFDVKPGGKYTLEPDQRVKLW